MRSTLFLLLLVVCSCGNNPSPEVRQKNNPVTVELLETYDIDEIKKEWLDAFKWTSENPPVAEDSEKKWADQFAAKGLRTLFINGYAHAIAFIRTKDIPAVDSMLAIPEVKNQFPEDLRFMWSKYEKEDPAEHFKGYLLYAVKLPKDKKAVVNSRDVLECVPADNEQYPSIDLNLVMTEKGARKLEAFTRKNENRFIAVVMDGTVVSCPHVQEVISAEMKLSQNFTMDQAGEISDRINAGRK